MDGTFGQMAYSSPPPAQWSACVLNFSGTKTRITTLKVYVALLFCYLNLISWLPEKERANQSVLELKLALKSQHPINFTWRILRVVLRRMTWWMSMF